MQDLTPSQILSCRMAAARFYRAGGSCSRRDFKDTLQDAYLIGLQIAPFYNAAQDEDEEDEVENDGAIDVDEGEDDGGKKKHRLSFANCVFYRLIDKYRAESKSRYRKEGDVNPLVYYSLETILERNPGYGDTLTREIAERWGDENCEKCYRIFADTGDGRGRVYEITETELERVIAKTLAGTQEWQRDCVVDYYYHNKKMREIGEERGKCESRISQLLADFRSRLRIAIIELCKKNDD